MVIGNLECALKLHFWGNVLTVINPGMIRTTIVVGTVVTLKTPTAKA